MTSKPRRSVTSLNQQPQLPRQCTVFYRRLCEVLQGERAGGVEELTKWASAAYAGLLKGFERSQHQLLMTSASAGQKSQQLAKERDSDAKLAKYRSRGLTYSIRHISPAILRRQRADHSQSKDLSTVIEELRQHRDLWDTYLGSFRDSLGAGISAEQKDAIVQRNDAKLYQVYKSTWPLIEKLHALKLDSD